VWLARRRDVLVPVRERSLDVFGDEKVLERLLAEPLFAADRLTMTQLRAYPCWPPVEQMVFGDAEWLVVENYTNTDQNRIWIATSALAQDLLAWCARLALTATAASYEPNGSACASWPSPDEPCAPPAAACCASTRAGPGPR
jgi:hypothetical protein